MVGCPADSLSLTVRRRIYAQRSVRRGGLTNVKSIDPVGLGTVDEEEIDLVGVVRGLNDLTRVCSGATGGELDHASAKSSRLALRSQKPIAGIDHQVVPVVDAIWDQEPVAALHELGDDGGFAALPNVHGMASQGPGCGKGTHVRMLRRGRDDSAPNASGPRVTGPVRR